MRTFINSVLLFAVLFSLAGCQRDDDGVNSLIWVESVIYQCCNVWGDPGIDGDIISMVSTFFQEEGMNTQEVEIVDRGNGVVCVHCCQCPTDEVVRVRLSSSFEEKAATFGFLVQ